MKGPSEVSERLTHRSCALPSSGTRSPGSSKPRANDAPLDAPEEGVDVLCRGRAEVHLVRALVHVHHEGRQRGGRRMRAIGHPVVLELPRVQVEPSRTQPLKAFLVVAPRNDRGRAASGVSVTILGWRADARINGPNENAAWLAFKRFDNAGRSTIPSGSSP